MTQTMSQITKSQLMWQHDSPLSKFKRYLYSPLGVPLPALTCKRSSRPVRACSQVRLCAYCSVFTTLVSTSSSGTMAPVLQPWRSIRSYKTMWTTLTSLLELGCFSIKCNIRWIESHINLSSHACVVFLIGTKLKIYVKAHCCFAVVADEVRTGICQLANSQEVVRQNDERWKCWETEPCHNTFCASRYENDSQPSHCRDGLQSRAPWTLANLSGVESHTDSPTTRGMHIDCSV